MQEVAAGRPNPIVSINTSGIGSNPGIGPGTLWQKRIETTHRVDQPFERGNKRGLRMEAAEALARAVAASEVRRAASDLAAAADRMERFETTLLGAARRTSEAVEFAFLRGTTSVLEALEARRTLRAVQVEALASARRPGACGGGTGARLGGTAALRRGGRHHPTAAPSKSALVRMARGVACA